MCVQLYVSMLTSYTQDTANSTGRHRCRPSYRDARHSVRVRAADVIFSIASLTVKLRGLGARRKLLEAFEPLGDEGLRRHKEERCDARTSRRS